MSGRVKRGARLAIVPGRALRDRSMTPKLREVLMAIAYYADRDGWCVIRVALLADLLGKNADNIRGDIRRLVALGYVEIAQRNGADGRRLANGYQLVLDGDLPEGRDRSAGDNTHLVDGDEEDPDEAAPLRAVSTHGGGSSAPRGAGGHDQGPEGGDDPGLRTKDTRAKDAPPTPQRAVAGSPWPSSVGGVAVSPHERDLTDEILREFNRQAGTGYTHPADHRRLVVSRLREYPDLTFEDHAAMIEAVLAAPWWTDEPSPRVVYANPGRFEQAREQLRATQRVGATERRRSLELDESMDEGRRRHQAELEAASSPEARAAREAARKAVLGGARR